MVGQLSEGGDRPSRAGSCDTRMISAAAFRKPVITALETKLVITPSRSAPSRNWITPE